MEWEAIKRKYLSGIILQIKMIKDKIYKPVAAALWCLSDHMWPVGHVFDNTGLDDNRCSAR